MAKAAQLGRRGSVSPSTVNRSVRESGMWVFGALAIIMLLALLSYSPSDPGFSNTGSGAGKLHNLIGGAGAWFADFGFYLFGMPAFLFPAMALLLGWILCMARTSSEPIDRSIFAARITGGPGPGIRPGAARCDVAVACTLAWCHFAVYRHVLVISDGLGG